MMTSCHPDLANLPIQKGKTLDTRFSALLWCMHHCSMHRNLDACKPVVSSESWTLVRIAHSYGNLYLCRGILKSRDEDEVQKQIRTRHSVIGINFRLLNHHQFHE